MSTDLVTWPNCYRELVVCSLVMAAPLPVLTTHCAYSWMDDQSELVWVTGLNTRMVYPRNGHPSQYQLGLM